MVMDTIQIRMGGSLIKEIDSFVESGFYANRADVIRDAVRRFVIDSQVGTIKNNKNSVQEVKEARKKLSEKIDLNEINSL